MNGLLTKDFLTIKNQGKSMIIILAISIMMILSGMNEAFVVGYITFVVSTFAVGTLSYDEYDHGYLYIFTLPIERKDYVIEKYLFSVILSVVGWMGSVLLIVGVETTQGKLLWNRDFGMQVVMMLILNLIYLEVILPVRLKYGTEKGKIVNFIIIGIVLLATMGITFLMKRIQTLGDIIEQLLRSMQSGYVCVLAGIYVLIAGIFSFMFSKRIIEKMEF